MKIGYARVSTGLGSLDVGILAGKHRVLASAAGEPTVEEWMTSGKGCEAKILRTGIATPISNGVRTRRMYVLPMVSPCNRCISVWGMD